MQPSWSRYSPAFGCYFQIALGTTFWWDRPCHSLHKPRRDKYNKNISKYFVEVDSDDESEQIDEERDKEEETLNVTKATKVPWSSKTLHTRPAQSTLGWWTHEPPLIKPYPHTIHLLRLVALAHSRPSRRSPMKNLLRPIRMVVSLQKKLMDQSRS